MAEVVIENNQQLFALANNQGLGLSPVIRLKSLGNLRTANQMYQFFHRFLQERRVICDELDLLEGFTWLARSLEHLRDMLQFLQPGNPQFALHVPALDGPGSVLHKFLELKFFGLGLDNSKKCIKYKAGELSRAVEMLARGIKGDSTLVLVGNLTIPAFQDRIPLHLSRIDNALDKAMHF